MGRHKCSIALKKGAWTVEEDTLLKRCIEQHGEGNWHKVPLRAGLNRCRKSCRLRWFNYLHPNIKREEFSWDEIDLIIKMHKLLGNRWSLIAARLPGRTANDVKNRWNTHIYKSLQKKQQTETTSTTPKIIKPIKPQPWKFSRTTKTGSNSLSIEKVKQCNALQHEKSVLEFEKEESIKWWETLLIDEEDDKETNSSRSGPKYDQFAFDSLPFDGIIVPNNDMMSSMCLDLNLWES